MTTADLYFDMHVDYPTREIALCGEFDAATAPCLATAIAGFQRVADGHITIRLDDLTFIDAAGIGAVDRANSSQTNRGEHLTVTGADVNVRRVFLLGKLAELLNTA
jgi:anti-anti-sigma factor